ncbi:tRNA (N6-isopentenyl adenosine(37)-C2)-methylthiotransferase MiaB [Proteiniclasticum sp.]|uniref:tRNA (N6-isopentenyl adenosine(37)-C2)-methylthiotransferase MiaB n=1 Tax=Proteiniclasticum sp. TaxID=2053595 RepID=UPI00289E1C25|nr:tRNA (N6-isopentenyl adenosine(37)-C2)-methylthiotransferase MiaB [Proteiniclasticum sp.]
MLNKKYLIETWGCQMNEEDSEKLSGMLRNMGYEETLFRDKADVIIFNTCAVRENAELKVYGNLGALKALKKKNPDMILAVCGCMMQQKGVPEEILRKYKQVDIVFGTHNAHKFPEYLERAKTENAQICEIYEKETEIIEGIPIVRDSDIKAFVTIMYGCNNFCTFCVVPYVRGRERSRKPEDILNEIRTLVSKGYREVTLLGQNVNSYGLNLDENVSFAKLLRMVNEVEGLERIRFMTSHPKDLQSDVIDAVAECDKVVEQVHLPVQSGSNALLKKMNRSYTREKYMEIVEKIKHDIPGVAITTDIIVGFPGETEEDFEETLKLVEEVKYDSAYTYIYSRRKYTPADRMKEQIPEEIKHERFNRLVEAINRHSIAINKTYQDQVVEVLVEGLSKNNEEYLQGRTRTGKTVNFPGNESLKGKLVDIRITKARSFSLMGEIAVQDDFESAQLNRS